MSSVPSLYVHNWSQHTRFSESNCFQWKVLQYLHLSWTSVLYQSQNKKKMTRFYPFLHRSTPSFDYVLQHPSDFLSVCTLVYWTSSLGLLVRSRPSKSKVTGSNPFEGGLVSSVQTLTDGLTCWSIQSYSLSGGLFWSVTPAVVSLSLSLSSGNCSHGFREWC